MRNRQKTGLTLVELLTVVTIFLLLMALLATVIGRAREKGRQVQCAGHLKQIGHAIGMFASDNNQYIPFATNSWARSNHSFVLLTNYLARSTGVFRCPSDRRRPTQTITNFASLASVTNSCSYSLARRLPWQSGFQEWIVALDRVGTSSNGFELLTPTNGVTGAKWAKSNHDAVGNILFGDGRVATHAQLPADIRTSYAPGGIAFQGGIISNDPPITVQNPL